MITHGEIRRESDWDTSAGVEGFIYVRAVCTITIKPKGCAHGILQEIASPGLFGIDDESSRQYLDEVFAEERDTLLAMLDEIGAVPE